ncbi:T9SS type A sorting domain-containing protein [bacterium]|nr:T9SS type A sorting domain-containing protein [bacterium]
MKKIFLSFTLLFTGILWAQNLKIVEINHQGNSVCLEVLNLDSQAWNFKVITYNSTGQVCPTCTTDQTNYNIAANDTLSISIQGTNDLNYGFWLNDPVFVDILMCSNSEDCWVSINGEISETDSSEVASYNAGNESTNPLLSLQYTNNNGTNEWVENLNASCGAPNTPLPIELGEFTAQLTNNDQHVLLSWETITEINNSGFYVQKFSSVDRTYKDIAFIDSKAANGNSSQPINYTFIDPFPTQGSNLYRLKQVDVDGETFSHSKTVAIGFDAIYLDSFFVYPNPTADLIKINYASAYDSISIYTQEGKRLLHAEGSDEIKEEYNLGSYQQNNGVFFIVLQKGNQSKNFKVVLQQ